MNYEYLSNVPLEEAKRKIFLALKNAGTSYKTETVPVREACGRVLAKAVYARRSSPHFLSCAMDGIALDSRIIRTASESRPVTLTTDDYVTVDTGDPLPEGTDCVVMIEQVVENDDGTVLLYASAAPWSNVRQIGEDVSMGDMVAPSFTPVTPALIGALLAAGVFEAEVISRPRAALIPTGDEIVSAESDLAEGDIPEYNSAIFSAQLSLWGAEPVVFPVVKDKKELIRAAVEKAASENDMVIVIAGSSAGRDDYTASVLKELGELVIHGIAVKPGKPAVLGHIGSVPFIGVPGYPVSGIIIMETVVREILSLLTKLPVTRREPLPAVVTKKLPSSLKYEEFIRCQAAEAGGTTVAVPMSRGAGIVSGFSKASGLITIPQNSEGCSAGETVYLSPLKEPEDIRRTLCVTGSHDPLIDEAADLLLRMADPFEPEFPPVLISSSHVGSMGAVTAVRNGEAHLGGIHLLDTSTGEYNRSYVRKYFPDGGAVLVKGVIRQQGLMIPKGNPKDIRGVADLTRISYVNRQKGAGTRILLDYLLAEEGIDPRDVYGYTKEEYTHTAVAAAISAGTADCGMGIFSAAKTYGLDFLYLWDEQYDFLINENAFGDYRVQRFLEILRSEEFRKRLEALGGYSVSGAGEVIAL